jgi:carboxylesterase type B
VYLYLFAYEVDPVVLDKVAHGLEVNILFGNNYAPPLFPAYTLGTADLDLSRAMAGYWTLFARTGSPNDDDDTTVHWPRFSRPRGRGRGVDKYLLLDLPVQEGLRLNETQCDFWEPYFLRSTTGAVPAHTP